MTAGLFEDMTLSEATDLRSRLRHEIGRRTRSAVRTSRLLKVCSACGLAKTHLEFGKHAGRADGLHPYCRACR